MIYIFKKPKDYKGSINFTGNYDDETRLFTIIEKRKRRIQNKKDNLWTLVISLDDIEKKLEWNFNSNWVLYDTIYRKIEGATIDWIENSCTEELKRKRYECLAKNSIYQQYNDLKIDVIMFMLQELYKQAYNRPIESDFEALERVRKLFKAHKVRLIRRN